MVTSSVTSRDQRPPDLRESATWIVTSYAPGNRRSRDPVHAPGLRECQNRGSVPCRLSARDASARRPGICSKNIFELRRLGMGGAMGIRTPDLLHAMRS